MKNFTRLACPTIIETHGERIGKEYEERRLANPAHRFQWPQIKGEKINQVIVPVLLEQTQKHCSYCDKFPLQRGDESIDHHKPKNNPDYYHLVCDWANLYIACKHCQDSKGVKYSELLLRPDAIDYSFSRYFSYKYADHTITTNPAADNTDQQRAAFTIEVFDLNNPNVKRSRLHAFQRFHGLPAPDIDDFNYRFMFA